MLIPTELPRTISSLNLVTPKFIKASCFTKADDEMINSIPEQVFKIITILKSHHDETSTTFSCIGSGVIVLAASDFYLAYISAHTLHPPGYNNLSIVSIKALINGHQYTCSVVEEGNYETEKTSESDWALLRIDIVKNVDFKVSLPSPSIRKSITQFTGSGFPANYNTLLFGYFTKDDAIEKHETKRIKDLGLGIVDVWKIVPQNVMSASLGWICGSKSSKAMFYNCGSTNCCSGGPVFECCLNIEKLLESEFKDQPNKLSRHLVALLNESNFQNKLLGIHCGGHKDEGNVFCSVDNFFESYYNKVYSPNKNYFFEQDRLFIENEWNLFKDK